MPEGKWKYLLRYLQRMLNRRIQLEKILSGSCEIKDRGWLSFFVCFSSGLENLTVKINLNIFGNFSILKVLKLNKNNNKQACDSKFNSFPAFKRYEALEREKSN